MTFESDAYEELTRGLVERLGSLHGVTTVRLERNVVCRGKATHHQIDVIWQFKSRGTDQVQTVLFECRHYKDAIKKGRLLEFKGVIDDIAAHGGSGRLENPVGTMVTLSKYQIGARRVAETYGLTITELRPPTSEDLAGRVLDIRVTMHARIPHVDNLQIEPAEPVGTDQPPEVGGVAEEFDIEYPGGSRINLVAHLLAGELAGFDEPPTVRHRVLRTFDPPVTLFVRDQPILPLKAAAADVSETVTETEFSMGGREYLAYVLLNALNGERVWFAEDGRTWSTDVPILV